MNKNQEIYAVGRVNQILQEKRRLLEKKHTTESIVLGNKARLELVRKNKVKLHTKVKTDALKDHEQGGVLNVYDFSKFENKGCFDEVNFNKEYKLFCDHAVKIRDNLVLGNAQEALEMINILETM